MDDALVAALREASAPPDKAQLVAPLSSKLGRNVTAKEVNKALYALAPWRGQASWRASR